MANEENLIPFKKGPDGRRTKSGRPKKLFSSFAAKMKEEGYERVRPSHLNEALSIMINLPLAKIAELVKDPDAPIGLKILASELSDKRKRGQAMERLLDRAFGKAALSEPSKQTELPKKIEVNIRKNDAD